MSLGGIPEYVLRYASVMAIAIGVAVLGLVIVVSIVHGVNPESGQLVAVLGVIGTLVSLIVNLLRTNQVANTVQRVESNQAEIDKKVTNHIDAHEALAAKQEGA